MDGCGVLAGASHRMDGVGAGESGVGRVRGRERALSKRRFGEETGCVKERRMVVLALN